MDVHMKSNSKLQIGTNAAGHKPEHGRELKLLSQEEQEILHFFDQTIVALEQSLVEDELKPQVKSLNNSARTDGSPKPGVHLHASPKEQDIIDLVRPKPDLVQIRETTFTPTNPDFQSLIQPPESHFEIKDYNTPITESYPVYHPPGSIPTPVLIAQKIAENQASGGSSVLSASSLLRRRSSEFDKSTSSNKQGPPTSTKPARYPANISVIHGNKEQPSQSLANINIEERRAQMLANLTGTSSPLVQEETQQDQKERNAPTRKVSFRDPTPEKSHMEALSKLGLNQSRAVSGGLPLPSSPADPPAGGEASATNLPKQSTGQVAESVLTKSKPQESSAPFSSKPQEPAHSAMASTSSKVSETKPRSPVLSYRKPEILPPDVQRSFQTSSYSPPPAFPQKDSFPVPPATPSVENSAAFNNYGGKSVVLNPSGSFKSDSPSSPVSPEPRGPPPIQTTPSKFNPYGGKSKVMAPILAPVSKGDLPDILSSHIDKSQTLHSPAENVSADPNSHGGKTRTVNPPSAASRPREGLSKTPKTPAPLPAQRAPRHSTAATPKPPQRALSPEHKRKTGSLFRPQGITVQFSGKGATDESRKEALRKLGLLKE